MTYQLPHSLTPPMIPYFLEIGEKDPVAKILEAMKQEDDKESGEEAVLCKNCEQVITHPEAVIIINQRFIHNFTNPGGFSFEVQCYYSAPGTTISGTPTEYFSWFKGYSWQYCYCKKCSSHIGWYFVKGEDCFYGLNLAMLKGDF